MNNKNPFKSKIPPFGYKKFHIRPKLDGSEWVEWNALSFENAVALEALLMIKFAPDLDDDKEWLLDPNNWEQKKGG